MKKIKDDFLTEIELHLKLALSFDWCASLGPQYFKVNPDHSTAFYGFIPGPTEPASRYRSLAVSLTDAVKFAADHRTAIAEAFHSQMIQSWFTFLSRIYQNLLLMATEGEVTFSLPKISIHLEPGLLRDEQLKLKVARQMAQKFDYLPHDDKFKIICKALKISSNKVKEGYPTVKGDIIIRNLIQHNHGKVRLEDLKSAGIEVFSSTDQFGNSQKFSVGDSIQRTPADLRALAHALEIVAENLVPEPG